MHEKDNCHVGSCNRFNGSFRAAATKCATGGKFDPRAKIRGNARSNYPAVSTAG